MKKKTAYLLYALFFIVVLLLFYINNKYYLPGAIWIEGQFQKGGKYMVEWDRGNGFEAYLKDTLSISDSSKQEIIELPQSSVRELRITLLDSTSDARIHNVRMLIDETFFDLKPINNKSVIIKSLDETRIAFHPVLFIVQVLMALVLTYVFGIFLKIFDKIIQSSFKNLLWIIFRKEQRFYFWFFFLGSLICFSFWLIGQYPGAMSQDSLYQWNETLLMDFSNNHPYISTVYFLFLRQLYDSPAIIAIFQIIATSALFSYIFHYTIKNGVKARYIIPIFLFFVSSVPIGLLNIILWKDVPFSLLLVFWGFYLYKQKHEAGEANQVYSFIKVITLSVMLVIMSLLRHNGIIYIIAIPCIFFVFKIFPVKVSSKISILSLILFVVLAWIIPDNLNIRIEKKEITNYWKINPVSVMFVNETYYSRDFEKDKKIIEKFLPIDTIKKYYNPSTTYLFDKIDFDKITKEDIKGLNYLYLKNNFFNFHILIGDRAQLFFTMLQSMSSMGWGSALTTDSLYRDIIRKMNVNRAMFEYQIQKSYPALSKFQYAFFLGTTVTPINMAMWNLLFPLLWVFLLVFLYKYIPNLSLSAFVMLIQVPVLFWVGVSPHFRYLYFIYLFAIASYPLLFLELSRNLQKSDDNIIRSKYQRYKEPLLMCFLIFLCWLPNILSVLIFYVFDLYSNLYLLF